ncbi:CPBP family intramembrane metalloprotease [Mycolicibacterium moriokaense]|nr:CPBP family intramembrane metalloprotease [Mycolicibacterium moriokaense]
MNSDAGTTRRLPIIGFLILVAAYLAIIQVLPKFTQPDDAQYAVFKSVSDIVRSPLVSAVAGSIIAILTVAYLRWWRPVFVEGNRTPRWTWWFPVIMLLTVVAGTSYRNLGDKGLTFTLALLATALLVGVSEETMFRGIGVVVFRTAGMTEGWVALWTSVVFGLAHSTNIFSEGVAAIPQVLTTTVAGYFFYLTRRVSGTLLVPIALHGLWDFGLFTTRVTDETALSAALFVLADVVLAIVAVVTIRKLFPRQREATAE